MEFDAKILSKIVKDKVNHKADRIITEAVFNLAHDVVELSPVGKYHSWSKKYQALAGEYGTDYIEGHYVLNWRFNKENNGQEIIDRGQNPKPKAIDNLFNDISKERNKFHQGGRWKLYNNAQYAMELELGWSHQAPMGIAALGTQRWSHHIKQAVQDVK